MILQRQRQLVGMLRVSRRPVIRCVALKFEVVQNQYPVVQYGDVGRLGELALTVEAGRLLEANPDIEVPTGRTIINDQGEEVAEMASFKEVLEDLDKDDAFNAQFKDCLG